MADRPPVRHSRTEEEISAISRDSYYTARGGTPTPSTQQAETPRTSRQSSDQAIVDGSITLFTTLLIPANDTSTPDHNQKLKRTPSTSSTKTTRPTPSNRQSTAATVRTTSQLNEDEIIRILSQRKTNYSLVGEEGHDPETNAEIKALLSSIFGNARRKGSQEEKARHLGVVFKDVYVKGVGLGAALQPTNGDLLLGPVRALKGLFAGGEKKVAGGGGGGSGGAIRTLIHRFSGCVKPSEMCLVLGRPGSGCSTFLKVIGNQRSGFVEVNGDVTYGGTDYKTMGKSYRGEVLYNPEDDLHYATLTVRNTLKFALETRTPGKESRRDGESREDYVKEFLRVISKLFWIEHTLDTKVGGGITRGVSGGEKKRVSIAEAMITKASVQCWDNSTRGLDASTAIEYVESLRTLSNMTDISTFVALYQAGESLYHLFDKVLLIDEGRCAYFGPTENARAYFEGLGFVCPPRWTTADFLTSVTDRHERQIKPGWESRIPRNAEEFAQAYRKSSIFTATQKDISEFESTIAAQQEERRRQATEKARTKNYAIPFHKQVYACTKRQFLVMLGDPKSLGGKWGGILFQSLIVGSLFHNLPQDSNGVFPRGGVLFFTVLFNALLALAELTAAFGSIPILLKHKSFSFYRPSAYAIALFIVDLPLCFVQVFIWNIVVYFMTGLQRTASQFLISLLIVFVLTASMYSFFRMIGAFSASLDVATRITGVSIQALVFYTGYLVPPSSMHPWLSWIRWINPIQYGFEALMANEFYNLNIQCVPPMLVPVGPGVEPRYQSCVLRGSQPGSTIVQGANYIQTQFTYSRSHLWRNIGFIIAFWIFFVIMTAVGLELKKPNRGGASVTVFKRGQAPAAVKRAMDKKDVEVGEKDPVVTGDEHNSGEVTEGVARNDSVFTWQGVTYTIPVKGGHKTLLNDVSGYVRPGKLTALMGESGAGKTTLLNTLAQRISFGKVTGDFLVDGKPLPKSFQRATGFAEQQDVHEPTATVREALRFSALLRQPQEVPLQEKYEYVETIIKLLEMEDIAGATVGSQGNGLNQEQRKRLTIGVELASKPELLMFLDEPTSGLDSNAAFNVVRFLRKLADSGQAILCTIHQPSAVLFEHFDDLLLLKSGGQVVYHGPLGNDSSTMIKYFESNGAPRCPEDKNPAEYMLEAIGAGDPNHKEQDWSEVWTNSSNHAARLSEINDLIATRLSKTSENQATDNREFAMPWHTQTLAVTKRAFTNYWRTPQYTIGKFSLHIFTGLFNSFTFYNLANTSIDMQSRFFSIFMTLTISPPLIQQLQAKFLHFRGLFMARERASKIYHWSAFVIGAILVEIPYSIAAGTIYFIAWFYPIGFPRDLFTVGYAYFLMLLFELYYVSFGQAIASFSPNELLASILVPVFFLFVISFCGVVVPYAAIPKFWRFVYYLTPFKYLVSGFLGVLVHDVPVRCAEREFARFELPPRVSSCAEYTAAFVQRLGGYVEEENGVCKFCQYRNGDEFAASFNARYKDRRRDLGISWAWIVFNLAVVFFGTWCFLGGWRRVIKVFKRQK
ncbi:putative ABC transporter [Choiromyces venosus 120613-1]|uniref:Putative ABC transporter n=1 Tax=Choiromyces venosus 120613-1 TaxID=1336337 RepID=A0A3N4JQJ3_9PEZI|nr:putative ABC transporter [Choiromyces venosus 120613-1]